MNRSETTWSVDKPPREGQPPCVGCRAQSCAGCRWGRLIIVFRITVAHTVNTAHWLRGSTYTRRETELCSPAPQSLQTNNGKGKSKIIVLAPVYRGETKARSNSVTHPRSLWQSRELNPGRMCPSPAAITPPLLWIWKAESMLPATYSPFWALLQVSRGFFDRLY